MSERIPAIAATTVGIDFRANALTVTAPCPPAWGIPRARLEAASYGTIDIGTRGRLLGIELEGEDGAPLLAISIDEPAPADTSVMRTARIAVAVERAGSGDGVVAVRFSRHGEGYDLSWPSGNQCWRQPAAGVDGAPAVTCAVVLSS